MLNQKDDSDAKTVETCVINILAVDSQILKFSALLFALS